VHSVAFSVDGARILSKSHFSSISWDAATGHQLRSIREPSLQLSQSIRVIRDGWVIDMATGVTLCKLSDELSNGCFASHKGSLAIGTDGGRVFLVHFPPALLTSPDTRLV